MTDSQALSPAGELTWHSLPPQPWPEHTEAPPEQAADWLTSLTREQLVWFLQMKRLDWAKDSDCFVRNHAGQIRHLEDRLNNRAEIVINPAIQSGEPCVGGFRIPVENVAGTAWWYGVGEAEHTYDVTRPQVLVACWYAAILPVRIWGRGGVLKAQRNPWPVRWREWAEVSHQALWSSKYDEVEDPPTRPATDRSRQSAVPGDDEPATSGSQPPSAESATAEEPR